MTHEKKEIWVIEDQRLFRECLIEIINNTPALTCTRYFNNCEEALLEFENNTSPDVILLDIGLPGISGIEGIKKFKELDPDIQIIIITVFDDSEKVFQAICAGAVGYLLKSTSEQNLVEAIHEVINGGSPINAQIARKVLNFFTTLNTQSGDYKLSEREEEILKLLGEDLTLKEIGQKLSLSRNTIHTYVSNIYQKLQVKNRSSAVAKALKEQII